MEWSSDDNEESDGVFIVPASRRLGTKEGPTVSLDGDTSGASVEPQLRTGVAPDAWR